MAEAGLVGSYLHGSLASGAYHPPKSDVDLLVVVERPLDVGLRERISLACVDAAATRPTLGTLEVSVLLREAASAGVFPMAYEIHFGENLVEAIVAGTVDYRVARSDPELAVHVRCLRETGVVLSGPPVNDVFAPVPEQSFRTSVRADLEWIVAGEHILETPVYGVLNLCRGLWLERGAGRSTPSKVEAGRWAAEVLPPTLRRTVREALEAHRDPSWVAPNHRRTAGRVWDAHALMSFRDALAAMLGLGAAEAAPDDAAP